MLQLMQTGALDMAILTAAEVSNRVPEFGAFYQPYLAANISEAETVLKSPTAQQLLELLPQRIGVIGLGYGMAGMRQILSSVPIKNLAGMRGHKIRITPFAPIRDFYQLLGVAPTPMPLDSVYDALANGQIDMLDMDLELILKLKYYRLANTLLLSNHMMFPAVAMISGKVWLRLSADDRTLISELAEKYMDKVLQTAVADEATWRSQVAELDITTLTVGPKFFGEAAQAWEQVWKDQSWIISALRSELEHTHE